MQKNLDLWLGVSLVVILLFEFILKDIPNLFYFDDRFKSVLVNISISYIAAYIFFTLQVRVPKKLEEEKLNKALIYPLEMMLKTMEDLLKTLYININLDIKDDDLGEKLSKAYVNFNMLTVTDKIRLFYNEENIVYFDYQEYIVNRESRIKRYINQIRNINNSNTELNIILDKIDNNGLFFINLSLFEIRHGKLGNPASFIAGDAYVKGIEEFYSVYFLLKDFNNSLNKYN